MKKYRFKLETLLKYRTSIEDIKSLELADAIRKYENQQRYINQLKSERGNCQKDFSVEQSHGISASQMTFYTNYIEELDAKIRDDTTTLKALHEQVEKKRQDFLEARKQRRVVEELKSSDFARYLKEMTRLEQLFIDEIASNQFGIRN
ncbi:TPA: flagellar export protein FliJ [Candidatus Poribacteria bacterium]|nr:flagellar export protein FliJ [Candidatus Poribacteria bacterium]